MGPHTVCLWGSEDNTVCSLLLPCRFREWNSAGGRPGVAAMTYSKVLAQPSPFIFTLWGLFIFTAHTQRL